MTEGNNHRSVDSTRKTQSEYPLEEAQQALHRKPQLRIEGLSEIGKSPLEREAQYHEYFADHKTDEWVRTPTTCCTDSESSWFSLGLDESEEKVEGITCPGAVEITVDGKTDLTASLEFDLEEPAMKDIGGEAEAGSEERLVALIESWNGNRVGLGGFDFDETFLENAGMSECEETYREELQELGSSIKALLRSSAVAETSKCEEGAATAGLSTFSSRTIIRTPSTADLRRLSCWVEKIVPAICRFQIEDLKRVLAPTQSYVRGAGGPLLLSNNDIYETGLEYQSEKETLPWESESELELEMGWRSSEGRAANDGHRLLDSDQIQNPGSKSLEGYLRFLAGIIGAQSSFWFAMSEIEGIKSREPSDPFAVLAAFDTKEMSALLGIHRRVGDIERQIFVSEVSRESELWAKLARVSEELEENGSPTFSVWSADSEWGGIEIIGENADGAETREEIELW